MNILESVKIAWKGIMSNKVRSLLTMLGVIIGVASVISLTSVGQGVTSDITASLEDMGTNLITVSGMRNMGGKLEMEDIESLEDSEYILAAVPSLTKSYVTIKYGSESMDEVTVEGTSQDYQAVNNFFVAEGRFLLEDDVDSRKKVCVVGQTIVDELFAGQNPIGEKISYDGQKYTVVGVMEEKGSSSMTDNDSYVFIPVSTAARTMGTTVLSTIYVQSASEEVTDAAVTHIENVYTEKFGNADAIRIFAMDELLETMDSTTAILTLLLGAIAGISLLVGGIGIMNIMLVSVTERTREIGIRKAIGARRKDILSQFLVESIILSLTGGIIGILLGVGLAKAAAALVTDLSTLVTPWSIILSFGFSVAIGVFFGIYPANKASKLDPIVALRQE